MFKTSRRLEIGVGSTQISRLQGSAGLRLPLSRALPHNARRKRPPRQRACERQGDTAHAPLPDGSREGGRGRGRRARGKWRRRRLRRTGQGVAAGWRWMQQVTGLAGAASGGSLRGTSRPPFRIPGEVGRVAATSLPGITCWRDVWPRLCHLVLSISWEGRGARTLTHSPFLPHIVVPSVMASGVTGSVSVALHPLVILNISDHWIRMRSQEGRPMQGECSA